ncbi:MAG: GNAT family N-acetyltransferase [Verrucomicrobiaceae bacterium]|nr:GNAT family N-acetyltransferase [Verrucomicrobiaceae bacterium]
MSDPSSSASPSPSSPEVVLVPIEAASIETLREMALTIFPATYEGLISPAQIEYMLDWMYGEDTLRREIIGDGVGYHWITVGGEKVGFLAVGPVATGEVCPLHKCYLLASRQGRGIGSAALAEIASHVAAAGASSLELRVNRENVAAIRFYQKNGFTLHAEDRCEIGNGFVMDDYLMRRELSR